MIACSEDLILLREARHAHPHQYLGMHFLQGRQDLGIVVRAYLQNVRCSYLVSPYGEFAMSRLDPSGIYEICLPECKAFFLYQFRVEDMQGHVRILHDPYRFPPTLSDADLSLFNQGKHAQVHHKLGAHCDKIQGVAGVRFALWAPNAGRVSVVGDFNAWDGHYHPMRKLGNSGVWELFLPHLASGMLYKFELLGFDQYLYLKSDPYASRYEAPPHNASIVEPVSTHVWHDADWMQARAGRDPQKQCLAIYELHFDSWKHVSKASGLRPYHYREMAPVLCQYLQKMRFTHVEFLPLNEFPFLGSWGYQVTGFFAPTQRYGSPDDFRYLVDRLHQEGFGVILDWVPGHFPKDDFSLARFDGTYLYEHKDPRQGEHKEWGTLVFNYARHEVRNFLICSALNWCECFHIDGLRVDAVASMIYRDYNRPPGQWIPDASGGREDLSAITFLQELNGVLHHHYPGILTIAEESSSFLGITAPIAEGGLGFDFKWNMGWMHDTLRYFSQDPMRRFQQHDRLTFGMLYQYSDHFITVLSHDEMVYGKASLLQKMPGNSTREKARELRCLLGFMWAWPGKKTLFMGGEFGQLNEWNHTQSLDWHLLAYDVHRGIQALVVDLNSLYSELAFLAAYEAIPEGFSWLICEDREHSIFAFLRQGAGVYERLLVVCNLMPIQRETYRVGVPVRGFWEYVLHTDARCYGGEVALTGSILTDDEPCHHQKYSLDLTLFGSSILFLRPKIEL